MRKQVKLLIVDEGEGYSELISQYADIWNEDYEMDCEVVSDATSAIERISDWQPSVVLVDAFIPDMVYTDFLEHCQTVEAPAVVMSEFPIDGIAQAVAERGAHGYVSKSEDPEDIEFFLEKIAEIAETIAGEH